MNRVKLAQFVLVVLFFVVVGEQCMIAQEDVPSGSISTTSTNRFNEPATTKISEAVRVALSDYRLATTADGKAEAEERVRLCIVQQFDADMDLRKRTIEQLKADLARAEEMIKRRNKNRQQIVDLRVKSLTNEATGLEWTNPSSSPGSIAPSNPREGFEIFPKRKADVGSARDSTNADEPTCVAEIASSEQEVKGLINILDAYLKLPKFRDRVSVQVNPATNSVTVRGTKEEIESIDKILQEWRTQNLRFIDFAADPTTQGSAGHREMPADFLGEWEVVSASYVVGGEKLDFSPITRVVLGTNEILFEHSGSRLEAYSITGTEKTENGIAVSAKNSVDRGPFLFRFSTQSAASPLGDLPKQTRLFAIHGFTDHKVGYEFSIQRVQRVHPSPTAVQAGSRKVGVGEFSSWLPEAELIPRPLWGEWRIINMVSETHSKTQPKPRSVHIRSSEMAMSIGESNSEGGESTQHFSVDALTARDSSCSLRATCKEDNSQVGMVMSFDFSEISKKMKLVIHFDPMQVGASDFHASDESQLRKSPAEVELQLERIPTSAELHRLSLSTSESASTPSSDSAPKAALSGDQQNGASTKSTSQRRNPVAVVLLMHPAELRGGNAIQRTATELVRKQLHANDFLNHLSYGPQGPQWLWTPGETMPTVGSLEAEADQLLAKSTNGDFPDFDAPLKMALTSLKDVKASSKLLLVLTDGDPVLKDESVIAEFKDAGIRIDMIHIELHDKKYRNLPERFADATGGNYLRIKPEFAAEVIPGIVDQCVGSL